MGLKKQLGNLKKGFIMISTKKLAKLIAKKYNLPLTESMQVSKILVVDWREDLKTKKHSDVLSCIETEGFIWPTYKNKSKRKRITARKETIRELKKIGEDKIIDFSYERVSGIVMKCKNCDLKPGRPWCVYKPKNPSSSKLMKVQPKGFPKTYTTKKDADYGVKMMKTFGSAISSNDIYNISTLLVVLLGKLGGKTRIPISEVMLAKSGNRKLAIKKDGTDLIVTLVKGKGLPDFQDTV